MQKSTLIAILLVFMMGFFARATSVQAQFFEKNNKMGIHVATPSEQDIKDAAKLVNANSSWGYITIVLQQKDRDKKALQHTCDLLRDAKLIPIWRLASRAEGDSWVVPEKRDAFLWADVLSSVNCTTKDMYVTLFNEVNRANEWGGAVDAKKYAQTALFFAQTLKAKSDDIKLMLAGLDSAAPHSLPQYEDEAIFLNEVFDTAPQLCTYLDAIASHSYPRGFVDPPGGSFGRQSITGYRFEQDLYKEKCGKKFPVFITETGWKNGELPSSLLDSYYKYAFEQVWNPDETVRAVTLYDLNGSPPNTEFAFRSATELVHGFAETDSTCGEFRESYCFIRDNVAKAKGDPTQKYSASILVTLPRTVIVNSDYEYDVWIKNNEYQSTAEWSKTDGYRLGIKDSPITYKFTDFYAVRPGNSFISTFSFNSGKLGKHRIHVCLFKRTECVSEFFAWDLAVIPPPSLKVSGSVFPFTPIEGDGFQLEIYRARDEKQVFKTQKISFMKGSAQIPEISNIALDEAYRIVLVALDKPYLPVQIGSYTFSGKDDAITFPTFFPIDFNGDGKFTLSDIMGIR